MHLGAGGAFCILKWSTFLRSHWFCNTPDCISIIGLNCLFASTTTCTTNQRQLLDVHSLLENAYSLQNDLTYSPFSAIVFGAFVDHQPFLTDVARTFQQQLHSAARLLARVQVTFERRSYVIERPLQDRTNTLSARQQTPPRTSGIGHPPSTASLTR